MLPLVENKRIFAGLRVSRLGWLLHNAGKANGARTTAHAQKWPD